MEAFSFLKYWRSSGGGSGGTTTILTADPTTNARSTPETLAAAASDSPYSSDGEDGPYFDLEFALPDQERDVDDEPLDKPPEDDQKSHGIENEDETESESGEILVHENDDDEGGELKFALASNECTDRTAAALSPSDELFFKGSLVSIAPSNILLSDSSEENSKLPVFLVKSATKFRVLLLKLKKSKSSNGGHLEKPEKSENNEDNVKKKENQGEVSGKFMAVRFKVEGAPLVSLFTRDNSSKENGHGRGQKNNVEDSISDSSDERKLTKDVVLQKYLKMVKPFYVRVSKRYVEKLKFSGHLGGMGPKGAPSPPCAAEKVREGVAAAARVNVKTDQPKQGNHNTTSMQAGLKVIVRNHLGKSRSASAAVAAAPPRKATSNRRDDSLAQLQDGIQGAILHCKRSFNASRDSEPSSILCRSVSDPSYEKSAVMPKASSSFSGEAKETKV